MSRPRDLRRHLTARYQSKQVKRFWYAEVTPHRKGHFRRHSAYSCSCRMCRNMKAWYKDPICRDMRAEVDYKEGLKETHNYSLDDKYLYD